MSSCLHMISRFAAVVLMAGEGLFDSLEADIEDEDEDEDDDDDNLFGTPTCQLSPVTNPRSKPSTSRSVKSTRCGFDAKFIAPLSEDQTCPICLMALREPKLTVCGHHCCGNCLGPLLGPLGPKKVVCPVCRICLTESEIYPDNRIERQILDLLVACDQHENGCEWTGKLRDQELHNMTCSYVRVSCPRLCGEFMLVIQVKEHEKVCMRKVVSCLYCDTKLESGDMDDHFTTCEKYLVPCPHNCGNEMTRKQLEHHLQQDLCSRVPIECEFKDFGCQFKSEKTAMEEHALTGVVSHLGLVTKRLREVDVKLTHETTQRMLLMPPGQFIYMWKIENWKEKIADTKTGRIRQIRSDKFYISHPGHCLYLRAYPNGMEITTANHFSLFLVPTPGKYDGQIKWPFIQLYSLSIVDQQPRGEDKVVDYSPPYGTFFDKPTSKGCGHLRFVNHQMLSTRCYIKNDCIVVKLVVFV